MNQSQKLEQWLNEVDVLSELNLIVLEIVKNSTFPKETKNLGGKMYIFDLLFRRQLLDKIIKYKAPFYLIENSVFESEIKDVIAIKHLSSEQKWILSFIRQGYTLNEIAQRLHTHTKYISKTIEDLCH